MPNHLHDHYVILNWNDRALRVILELHSDVICAEFGVVPVVVVTDDVTVDQELVKRDSSKSNVFEDVFFCIGDPTSDWALRNANCLDARSVIVLANDRGGKRKHADERTIRSIFMLRRLALQRGLDQLHVVAEQVDLANTPVLEEAQRDFPGMLEIVGGQIKTLLLAQSALHHGLSGLYNDLLSVTSASNEVYVKEIPRSAAGMKFSSYAAKVLAHRPEHPIIPIGVRRGKQAQIVCNPKPEHDEHILQAGDYLVVIAYAPPADEDFPEG